MMIAKLHFTYHETLQEQQLLQGVTKAGLLGMVQKVKLALGVFSMAD